MLFAVHVAFEFCLKEVGLRCSSSCEKVNTVNELLSIWGISSVL